MWYHIDEGEGGLEITVGDFAGSRAQLLEQFHACQGGTCRCPTDEYTKLDRLEVEEGQGVIRLRLTPRAGETLDRSEIERCLRYTASLA